MVFIDRNEIRNSISQILDGVNSGIAHCIWIEGESGTGKSWLTKFIVENHKMDYLLYSDNNEFIYKCRENSTAIEYAWVSKVLSYYQKKYPNRFNQYCVKHFQGLYVSSLNEIVAQIIPNISKMRWTKDAVNARLDRIENARGDIEGRLYTCGLTDYFAELIFYLFTTIEKRTSYIICIDDAAWMDELSIDVLNSLLKKSSLSNNALKISIILTTRSLNSLASDNNNYKLLESVLQDCFQNNLDYFRIKNFDYYETYEYLKAKKIQNIEIKVSSIFEFTQGNPYGLFQTLKFKDDEIDGLINDKNTITTESHGNSASTVSLDRIIILNDRNEYVIPILTCIAAIDSSVDRVTLTQITRGLVTQVSRSEYQHMKYDECLNLLIKEDMILSDDFGFSTSHDSIREGLFTYLKECGEYSVYMDIITSILNAPNYKQYEGDLFAILNMYSPEKCFYSFVERIDANTFNTRYIGIVADGVGKAVSVYSVDNVEKYIIPHILIDCVKKNYYDSAFNICRIIYPLCERLNPKSRMIFFMEYTRILIDMGKITESTGSPYALELSGKMLEEASCKDDIVMAHLVNMSAYEHILDFKKIEMHNNEITPLINSNELTSLTKALYYRNQGLVKSHRLLKNDYQAALDNAELIENTTDREIMLGTCSNNMGLYYLYSGSVKSAEIFFEKSKEHLKNSGYSDFRAINNLGVCALLCNDVSTAYDFFIEADSRNRLCIFEKLCIKSNIAIAEWKNGHKQEALNILSELIENYKAHSLQTYDELVYTSAYVNMGYMMYSDNKYYDAFEMYNRSISFAYRYDNDMQLKKRKDMVNLCLYKAGTIDLPTIDIDIQDTNSNLFTKMYAPIAFAYYVI